MENRGLTAKKQYDMLVLLLAEDIARICKIK